MSGIETVVGLAIGVVPIVVEILKSYSTAKRRLGTFSRHTDVASDILLRFQVAAANFNNDCRLLLQAVVSQPGEVSEMIGDPMHKAWQEKGEDMEKRLQSLMQQDYDLCQNIVTRLRDILRETRESLAKLEGGLNNSKQSHHEVTRKIWHAFNISRKENEYIRQLDCLDNWNKALSKLRKQRCKIQKRRTVSSSCIIRKAVPRSYQQIRAASQQLGESLHDSWSCTNSSHSGHQAKLSFEARNVNEDIQLDIVVACQTKPDGTNQRPPLDRPIWLQIRSVTSLATPKTPTLPPPKLLNTLRDKFEVKTAESPAKAKPAKSSSKKRVRFDNSGDGGSVQKPQSGSTGTTNAQSFVMLDLKTTKSVCCHLSKISSSTSSCQDGCVGYLDVSRAIPVTRFIFYDASKLAKEASSLCAPQDATPINSLVERLQILQQITLAHKLAEAVLHYHSTPWLPQAWTLQDIGYFTNAAQTTENDLSEALNSLHLNNRFPDQKSLDPETKQEVLELKHTYGIRNLTLAKLGVAMLEICAKRYITAPRLSQTPYEIIEARKLLDEKHHSIMTLGSRYLDLVRKCIHCDFSCDDDLNGEALQSAVYTEIVCALQEMKTRWEKVFGICS
ncbi:hypothetical protein DM02DRAFT_693184 [Periconia macrospinosa]|uniref:Uncharacterized protein n=1 Tax=Periconia macrospinosa TaxID=97972 RepID=A0A2V1DB21_9PLEO|nr:hypothetical protein DM02DRAFT_693184 [Periconia macrospinosa]